MAIYTIKFKFLSTIIASILAVSIFIGGLSIYGIDSYIQRQTRSFIDVTSEKEVSQMNGIFKDMEKSVDIMSGYILDFCDSFEEVKTREKQNEIIEYADRMFADIAKHTVGTVAYYLRFAVEISDSKTGFFFSKTQDTDEFINYEITDIALYDRDDTEHVGWYWQPRDAGKPIWMQPYYNQNNDITMISYVIPLYCEGEFIAVVGMDFDYTVLIDKVHSIEIYENGFAHLEIDGVPIHNDEAPDNYLPEEFLQVSNELTNGMTLVISASYDDIKEIRYNIGFQIFYCVVILTAVFCLIAIVIVGRIVYPLKKLTEASKKLAAGDYDVEAVKSDTYEIQLLSTAFENMTMNLREHEKLQQLIAYRDSLTGLRNTTSYKIWSTDIDKEIQNKSADFGIIVFDVNYLKETNDKFGHDVGNKLIVAVAGLISGVFLRSPVFRIGGDEFLVILQNRDMDDHEELLEKFDAECANEFIEANGEKIPISIARGFAKYAPDTDTRFVDVFNRADDAMYKHKRQIKSSQKALWLSYKDSDNA